MLVRLPRVAHVVHDQSLAAGNQLPTLKNQPQRMSTRGVGVRRLDHVNVWCRDIDENSAYMVETLGFRVSERVVGDDGRLVGSWLHVTPKSYDLAYGRVDPAGVGGRLHEEEGPFARHHGHAGRLADQGRSGERVVHVGGAGVAVHPAGPDDQKPVVDRRRHSEVRPGRRIRRGVEAGRNPFEFALEEVSPTERLYRYSIVESPLPISDYFAEIRVKDNGDGTSTVEWSSDFKVNTSSERDVVKTVQEVYQAGLDNLSKLYGFGRR